MLKESEGAVKVAALYVATGGCYFGLPDVDPWDEKRDARLYAGPHPVVAHPPCQRWSRLAHIHKHKPGKGIGQDGDCFSAALSAVRRWGGVLEHPAGSAAWAAFDLARPPRAGGWVPADRFGGWTCHVEQGHYGHRARKATWLYAVVATSAVDRLPELVWGPSGKSGNWASVQWMPSTGGARAATPIPFRDLLLGIARSALPACARAA